MRLRAQTKVEIVDDYPHLSQAVDDWLWIPWRKWLKRWHGRRYHWRNLETRRRNNKLAMRRMRDRKKAESISRTIAAVYWHEVHRPTVPIRQYR